MFTPALLLRAFIVASFTDGEYSFEIVWQFLFTYLSCVDTLVIPSYANHMEFDDKFFPRASVNMVE